MKRKEAEHGEGKDEQDAGQGKDWEKRNEREIQSQRPRVLTGGRHEKRKGDSPRRAAQNASGREADAQRESGQSGRRSTHGLANQTGGREPKEPAAQLKSSAEHGRQGRNPPRRFKTESILNTARLGNRLRPKPEAR